jgi:hypothetical protein
MMQVREARPIIAPEDVGRPLVAPRHRARARSVFGAMFSVPLVVLAAMVALIAFDEHPASTPGQRIELRSAGGGTATAIVLGAGTGVHLVRVSGVGVPLEADLSAGQLQVFSLRSVQIRANGVSGKEVTLRATGHVLRIRSDDGGVMVRTGM